MAKIADLKAFFVFTLYSLVAFCFGSLRAAWVLDAFVLAYELDGLLTFLCALAFGLITAFQTKLFLCRDWGLVVLASQCGSHQ